MRKTWLPAACVLLASACVTSGKYDQKVQESDYYQKSLKAELDKSADLAKKVDALTANVQVLEKQKEVLDKKLEGLGMSLADREAALKAAADKAGELQASVAELSQTKVQLELSKAQLEARTAALEKRSAEYEQLASSLKGEIDQGKIELSEMKGRMTVKLKDKILFASGSASLGKEGKAALAKVADAFKELKGRIVRVEGHTDDRPIGSAAFPSNWELSGARSLAVVRFLEEKGVDPKLLAGAAYSQFRPVADNGTPEGRSQNRRIDIVLAAAEQ
ncbi:MAG: OmpA family protein [Anaeromyxobacteraceae bacterium]